MHRKILTDRQPEAILPCRMKRHCCKEWRKPPLPNTPFKRQAVKDGPTSVSDGFTAFCHRSRHGQAGRALYCKRASEQDCWLMVRRSCGINTDANIDTDPDTGVSNRHHRKCHRAGVHINVNQYRVAGRRELRVVMYVRLNLEIIIGWRSCRVNFTRSLSCVGVLVLFGPYPSILSCVVDTIF